MPQPLSEGDGDHDTTTVCEAATTLAASPWLKRKRASDQFPSLLLTHFTDAGEIRKRKVGRCAGVCRLYDLASCEAAQPVGDRHIDDTESKRDVMSRRRDLASLWRAPLDLIQSS